MVLFKTIKSIWSTPQINTFSSGSYFVHTYFHYISYFKINKTDVFLLLKDEDKLKEEEIADEHLEAKKDNNEKITVWRNIV